jgi:hypothetical protein
MRVTADPRPEQAVRSQRGLVQVGGRGETFRIDSLRHGDGRPLINRAIESWSAFDGGGTVSLDGGRAWSTIDNQPTPNLLRHVDRVSYNVMNRQDNSTIRLPSRFERAFHRFWEDVGGCEDGRSPSIAKHRHRCWAAAARC